MIARTSWRESKILKTFYGNDLFLCRQTWPLPAFHLDPRAAKRHLSTRGHVGHFLLLCSEKRERERFPKQMPFQNGTLHWLPWLLPLQWGGMLRKGSRTWAGSSRADVTLCHYCKAISMWWGFLLVWRVKCKSLWCHDFMVPLTGISDPCTCTHVFMRAWEREIHTRARVHTHICSHKYLYPLRPTL